MIAAFGTLAATAKAAGVSVNTITAWRKGERAPKPDVLASLRRKAAARLRAQATPATSVAPSVLGSGAPLDTGTAATALSGSAADDDDDNAPPTVRETDPRPAGLRSGPAPIVDAVSVANLPSTPAKASAKGKASGINFFGLPLQPRGPARPLSEGEIAKLRTALTNLLRKAGEYTDEAISATNRKHAKADIWGNMDDQELGILVDFIIERGKVSARAAQVARGLADLWDQTAVLMVLGPRVFSSVLFYRLSGGFGW